MRLHVGIAQVPRHLAFDLALEIAHSPAQAAQLGARVFADLAGGSDDPGERLLERAQIGEGLRERGEPRRDRGALRQRLAHPPRSFERGEKLRELAGSERSAARDLGDVCAQIGDAAEARLAPAVDELPGLTGLGKPLDYTSVRRRECDGAKRLGAARGRGLRGEAVEQTLPLQTRQGRGIAAEGHGAGF